jgi:hypothetical protein
MAALVGLAVKMRDSTRSPGSWLHGRPQIRMSWLTALPTPAGERDAAAWVD